eukprot:gene8647-11688_t
MNGIIVFAAICILCLSLSYWFTRSNNIYCVVSNSVSVNGYYEAKGGLYIQKGRYLVFIPDIFYLWNLLNVNEIDSDVHIIMLSKLNWIIRSIQNNKIIYQQQITNSNYLSSPGYYNWTTLVHEYEPSPTSRCVGSLQNSRSSNYYNNNNNFQESNIGKLLNTPVNTLILLIIFIVAYYLWSQRIDVSVVSYSYDSVMNKKEYWRMISSSFSHFEIFHLIFNTMSLYQLGMLENMLGSMLYLYLSFDIMFITMLILTLLYHVFIHYYNQPDYINQQGVGYSCVLFAWIVVISVKMKTYCPIFFLPSLCFPTFFLPFINIPMNIGPFIILIVTKVIIPRSSFIGHLSGIIIGYPLAWGWIYVTYLLFVIHGVRECVTNDWLVKVGLDNNSIHHDLQLLSCKPIITKIKLYFGWNVIAFSGRGNRLLSNNTQPITTTINL